MPVAATKYDLFAVCLPGLEPLLAEELRLLGLDAVTVLAGGIACRGDLDQVYRINLESGIASHVLLRIAEFGARSLADLDHRGARIDWRRFLHAGTPTLVRARCRRSRIYHSGAAEERIARHLLDQLGAVQEGDPAAANPIAIRVRIDDNRCTISLDTSGEPLHRRGWRLEPGAAPLREDLAYALLSVSGWDRRSAFIDPMMGSGTILIEAAGMARQLAPGRLRAFAIEHFELHAPERLAAIRARAASRALPQLGFPVLGSDRDARALSATRENAERAGVIGDLTLDTASLTEALAPFEKLPGGMPAVGALVTNPPYGERLDDRSSLPKLYRAMGTLVRKLPAGWTAALAAADPRLARRSGLRLATAFLADSGGLKIRAMTTQPSRDPGRAPPSSDP